jgi:hypothetical protein
MDLKRLYFGDEAEEEEDEEKVSGHGSNANSSSDQSGDMEEAVEDED